jgi:HSP20 family protein
MTALALTPNGVKKPMLSNVFEEWFGNDLLKGSNIMLPKTNIIENDDHYLIELSVPGYQKNDFDIQVDRRLLTVSHSKEDSTDDESHSYIVRGFSKNSFSKSFSLSPSVDSDKISATCTDGVLSIFIPKKEEAKSKPVRKIKIK